ncbi:MBL fold metallo-hydrolase [Phytoactinopolyspora alkaliphila]|uniref:MBL fold metallo-hydrolase n=1 Tax=Phytoactinopolyspora alkaliphila TaxID=1783498 RepID=A0A6N9YLR8_9ACTN|nr:MBL fold metallo-hydrolase [Phytoactinopolyspora alkaliphila]NED95943.1 MBL fold metallo-hydrolase [Phytoactinopolyspora alkaliphila]
MSSLVSEVAPGVFRLRDTCNVYVIRQDTESEGPTTGIAVDFGSGAVLDHLHEMGIERLTHVLMTHHHRDQGQGLHRAVAAGVEIHVPPVEQDLFGAVDKMWSSRPMVNDYNLRQDKFSLLEPVVVAGTVPEYRSAEYGGITVRVLPTPGHTTGSVTYVVARDGQEIAFTGDLIYAPGKVWSLAATQWSYTENEGPAMVVLSCLQLMNEPLDVLLPSHGEPMTEPRAALELLAERMGRYVDSRRPYPWDLDSLLNHPFIELTPHLLMNRTSNSCSYVLVSETGAAMIIDYGYDTTTGLPAGTDRASRRPWLASLPALRRNHGVSSVEVALLTHYHDDHVAGVPLLRDVEGAEVWAPANVAPILENPDHYDLPCLWYDPIPVDRRLPLEESFQWHEYEITVHELPGHTLYAAGFEFEVDGLRVLVTGDQQDTQGIPGERREILNYQYRNLFRIEDYRHSAALFRKIAPGVMISGHWAPRWVDNAYLDMIADDAEQLVEIHQELLPLDEVNLGADGIAARIAPYRSSAATGERVRLEVTVHNPLHDAVDATIAPVLPEGWTSAPGVVVLKLEPGETATAMVDVVAGDSVQHRARVAVDVTFGNLRLGQHAEALIDIVPAT